MRLEVIAVGRELLIGRTMNSNAHWVGRRASLMGTMLSRVETVDDDLREIGDGLRASLSRECDFIVMIGGLGPTPDDMTLRGVAEGLGRPLKLDPKALKMVREHYALRGLAMPMTPARRKMALVPEGSVALPNPTGTAPGVRIDEGRSVIFCLPGVPSEMKGIFLDSVEPEVETALGPRRRSSIRMRIDGIYESSLAPQIERMLRTHPGAYVKSHPRGVEEGVSRIELDIVVVSGSESGSAEVASAIGEGIAQWVRRNGGTVKSVKTTGVPGGMKKRT